MDICKLSDKNIIKDDYNVIRKMVTDCGGPVFKVSKDWEDVDCSKCLDTRGK